MARLLPFILLLALAAPGPVQGQAEVEAVLQGQLFVAGVPQDSGTVVLHRIPPQDAVDEAPASVDSITVQEDGTFSFVLPNLPVPGSGELFFASSRYEGIVYYGEAVREPAALDSLYRIDAYPTEPAPVGGYRLPLTLREIWIEEGPIGWQVTDAFVVLNGSLTTFVPMEVDGAVWRYPIPSEAEGVRVIEAGPVPGPVRLEGGLLIAGNPIVPGRNFVMIEYVVPSLEFDLHLPGESEVVRIFMQGPVPPVRVEGLVRLPDQETGFGTTYLQWAGQGLLDQVVRIRPGEESEAQMVVWLSIVLALLLVGAGAWAVGRRPAGSPAASGPGVPPKGARQERAGQKTKGQELAGQKPMRLRKDILIDVARLDEAHAQLDKPDAEVDERYRRRRAALIQELEASGRRDAEEAGR